MRKIIIRILKKILKEITKSKTETTETTETDMYRNRGAKIGQGTVLYNVAIDGCFGYLVSIGENTTITHSSIIAHDSSTKREIGYSKVSPVSIGNNCF